MRKRGEDFQSSSQKQSPGRVRHGTLLLDQIQNSLQKPLDQRCEDVRKMIDEFSIEDLHLLYPHLLGNIFGFITSKIWALQSPYSRYFEGLRRFLGPCGIVWRLVEKLDKDTFLRYDFPFSCLPKPTRTLLTEGHIPTLYYNKVQFSGANQILSVINLGAMEYFLFHFAYFITQSVSQMDNKCFERSHETVYSALLTDYLEYFLPTNIPLATSERYSGSYTKPDMRKHFHSSPSQQGLRTSTPFSGLIKSFENKPHSCGPHFDQTSSQFMKSERFLQILMEFWLNHIVSNERNTLSPFVQDYFLPSIDHVRVVRMLVKHLHTFMYINMQQYVGVSSFEMNNEFYRSFMPDSLKLFKKDIYCFIHHCFAQWPLDSSFKFILETWLSYIQPWRYSLHHYRAPHNQTGSQAFSPFWKPFVHHNLLFYTVIFQEFLSRAEKLSLRSSRDTQLFFRVIKVFSQKNLMLVINEVEGDLIAYLSSTESHLRHSPRSAKPPEFVHFTELWNPGNIYKPLFSQEIINNICYLVRHIRSTLRSLREPQDPKTHKTQKIGWFKSRIKNTINWLQDVFSIDENYWLLQDENRKTQKNLEYISQQLRVIFQIPDDEVDGYYMTEVDGRTAISEIRSQDLNSGQSKPDCVETEQGMVLTALGKYQIANGIRRFDIQYSRDPDFQPVRTYEITSLVRFFYKLSTKLNEKLGPKLMNIYYSPGWPGSLARHVSPGVQSPHTLSPVKHDRVTCAPGQPKISLRFLASTRLWAQLFLLMFVFVFVLDRPYFATFLIFLILIVMFLRHINVAKRLDKRKRTGDESY